jgi:hypothetical protein
VTTWGGVEVLEFARQAGFTGDEVKRAACVAYAASQWRDHFESVIPGSPSLDRFGLWGLTLEELDGWSPRSAMNPRMSAEIAYAQWVAAGGTWDWHSIVQAGGGAVLRAAWSTIEAQHLWETRAPSRQPLART